MSNKTVFDRVINYIDENITKETQEILLGLPEIIGMSIVKYQNYYKVLTGQTLVDYIRERRLYWAAWELKEVPEKPIAEIALSYGYSEQSALTRAISSNYNASPMDIRNRKCELINNRPDFQSITNPGIPKSTLDHILEVLETGNSLSGYLTTIIEKYADAQHQYPFSSTVIATVFDLAEQMQVPVELLLDACFDVYTEVKGNPNEYVLDSDYATAAAIECGITSEAELVEICQYFDCSPIDLNAWLVEAYRSRDLRNSPHSDTEETYVEPS